MTDTTRTSQPSTAGTGASRRLFGRAALATVIVGVLAGLGVTARAYAPGGWHHGGFLGDPAKMDAHLDRMLKHLYVEIGATDAQQQLLAPIVKGAAQEFLPLRAKMHEAHRRAAELLSQDTVDRAALETLRADHMRLAEQASTRFVQALADVADVLTPEQRRQLAAHIGRWHGAAGKL
jgi:Spy/CpxP family protein refolding chaperone